MSKFLVVINSVCIGTNLTLLLLGQGSLYTLLIVAMNIGVGYLALSQLEDAA